MVGSDRQRIGAADGDWNRSIGHGDRLVLPNPARLSVPLFYVHQLSDDRAAADIHGAIGITV